MNNSANQPTENERPTNLVDRCGLERSVYLQRVIAKYQDGREFPVVMTEKEMRHLSQLYLEAAIRYGKSPEKIIGKTPTLEKVAAAALESLKYGEYALKYNDLPDTLKEFGNQLFSFVCRGDDTQRVR
jgi:hypothetical protein